MPIASDTSLATTIAGLTLRNPVILAAGTAGTLNELERVCPLGKVGGLVTKSLTPEAREGNETWRILECRGGMLNAIGLANPGIGAFTEHLAQRAAGMATTVIGSAAGFSVDDYVKVVAGLDEWAERGIPAIEVNVSCPNVKTGTEFGHSAGMIRELMMAVRPVAHTAKLFVKLSPVTPDLLGVARAAVDAGADGLTICNTIPAMGIDVETRRARLANVTGGLSGPALHAVAVRLVHEVYRGVAKGAGVPIIGCGGVMNWRDAAEFILAGATGVEMGTALFVDPRSPARVVRGLARWVRGQGCRSVGELVGAMVA